MTAIYAVTFVMSAVLICKWTLSHYDDDDDDGQATCSEGGLDIASNSGLEGDRVTDLCGTARLGGQLCPRKSGYMSK